jgi:hypothetical protein
MAESVNQRTRDGLSVWAGAFERPFDARLQSALRDSFAVAADEQRGARRPPRQAGSRCRSALLGLGKADGAAVEVGLDNGEEFGFDRDAAFFAAFTLDVMTAAPASVVRMSPTSAWRSSSARSPARSAVRMIARSRSAQSVWRLEPWCCATVSSRVSTAVRRSRFGQCLGQLWPAN